MPTRPQSGPISRGPEARREERKGVSRPAHTSQLSVSGKGSPRTDKTARPVDHNTLVPRHPPTTPLLPTIPVWAGSAKVPLSGDCLREGGGSRKEGGPGGVGSGKWVVGRGQFSREQRGLYPAHVHRYMYLLVDGTYRWEGSPPLSEDVHGSRTTPPRLALPHTQAHLLSTGLPCRPNRLSGLYVGWSAPNIMASFCPPSVTLSLKS